MTEELKRDQPESPKRADIEQEGGKWYLTYEWNDTFGGGLGGTWEHKRVKLKATTEEDARKEATEKWNGLVAQELKSFEHKRSTYAIPPRKPFLDGPINPRVTYEIRLAIDKVMNGADRSFEK